MLFLSRYKVFGHSMVPSLLPGDEILVSSLPYIFAKPCPDDVVLFLDPGSNKHLVKRIGKIKGNKLYLKGDNAVDSKDSRHYGWVYGKFLIGKMLYKL